MHTVYFTVMPRCQSPFPDVWYISFVKRRRKFEPKFSEHLKEASVANGDYPANAGVQFIIIYDILWLLERVKTPVFIYSL